MHGDERCPEDEHRDCNKCHVGNVPKRSQEPGGVSFSDTGEMRSFDLSRQFFKHATPVDLPMCVSARFFSEMLFHLSPFGDGCGLTSADTFFVAIYLCKTVELSDTRNSSKIIIGM